MEDMKLLEKRTSVKNADDALNKQYIKGEVRIITEQARYPLNAIVAMIDGESYDLNPEYQRRKRWDNKRKSRLIESFIMNVPIPPIFLYEVEYAHYEVMDGLQRLSTIYDFYKDLFKLEGLEYWEGLNGRSYGELPKKVREGIDRRYLSSIILLHETAQKEEDAAFLKTMVFERLNSGGEKLVPQEIRNALHNGKFNQLCITLAQEAIFRKMWCMPLEEEQLLKHEPYKKMDDVEHVLRFFAYQDVRLLKGLTTEKFLDKYLIEANQFSDNELAKLTILFKDTIQLIYDILGETAFTMPSEDRQNTKATKTIYDPLMRSFAKTLHSKGALISHKEEIKGALYVDKEKLVKKDKIKNNQLFDGKYNSWKDVENRTVYFDEILSQYTNDQISSEEVNILAKIASDSQRLDSILFIKRGIECGKSDKITEFKLLSGEDIGKYQIRFGDNYINCNELNLAKYKSLSIYSQEKILIRRVSDKIIATYDQSGFIVLNTVYSSIKIAPKTWLKYQLAILNSSLIHFWFTAKFVSNNKSFSYIRVSQLASIPIKLAPNQQPFIDLVDYVLYLQSSANTVPINEHVSNEHIAQKFEGIIDAMVYELYFEEEVKSKNTDIIALVTQDLENVKSLESVEEQISHLFEHWSAYKNEVRNRILLQEIRCESIVTILESFNRR